MRAATSVGPIPRRVSLYQERTNVKEDAMYVSIGTVLAAVLIIALLVWIL
jgi:hypothetical protein